jgi:hypothetical protein
MTKRFMVSALVVAAVVAVGGVVYTKTRPGATPEYWAKAKATRKVAACLPANSHLSVPDNVRSDIEMRAISYLIDVPAGTNVDVKLATYTANTVTGSDYYPAKYGNYNFAMVKQSDGWHFTSFEHCY